jgi:hypothetical protein
MFWNGCNLIFFLLFIFYLVWLMLGCIPKISFLPCLEVTLKCVWWVVVKKVNGRLLCVVGSVVCEYEYE